MSSAVNAVTLSGVDDLLGQIVDGKYRVERVLGRGGMGAVLRAIHLGTDRAVALKIIHPSLADDPAYLARFRREARACGRLRHPNIVDVTDFGVCEHRGRQLAYLVMEYLDGCTLADVLQAEPIPPLAWTIDILEQVSDAVEEGHRQGILHRDLKPENVWLEPNRRGGYSVKVLDFGLAKLDVPEATVPLPSLDGEAPPLHEDGESAATYVAPSRPGMMSTTVSGTPGYMSPEQVRAGEVTSRTDVYSLGVIAFRMLTGREPFAGSIQDVLDAHVNAAPPPLGTFNPSISDDASRLVMAALSKDPAARPASAGAFGNMLAGCLEPASVSFRKALTLFLERLRIFLTIGTACFLPALIWSLLLAAWAAGHAATPAVPAPIGLRAIGPFAVWGILAVAGAFAMGVTPVVVLHALAAPQRPIDLASLRRVYEARVRAWLRAILPMIWPQLLAMLLLIAGMSASSVLRPWTRTFDRPVRVVLVFGFLLPYVIAQYWAVRRLGTGLQHGQFVGPVMLVEGLPFEAARKRSIALSEGSGRLQRRGRIVLMISLGVAGGVMGILTGRARLTAPLFAALTPVFTLLIIVGMTFVAVMMSLTYFTARRALGESIDRALVDFERAVLPETHWQRSHRERVMDHVSTGSSAALTRPGSPS